MKLETTLGSLFGILLGLSLGNFVLISCGENTFIRACERSFFEFIALFAVFILAKVKK